MHNQVQAYIKLQQQASDKEAFTRKEGAIHLAAWLGIIKGCLALHTQEGNSEEIETFTEYLNSCNGLDTYEVAREVRMCKKSKTHNKQITKLIFKVERPTSDYSSADHWGAYRLLTRTLMEKCDAKYNYGEAPRGGQERIL